MKSYKDMADNVFSRIVLEKEIEIKKRRNRVYMASSMAVFGLALLIGAGVWLNGKIIVGEPGSTQTAGTENCETEESVVSQELLDRMAIAVWDTPLSFGPDIGPFYSRYENGLKCVDPLCSLLADNPDTIYAIGVSLDYVLSEARLDTYVWTNGKTFSQIEQEYEEIWEEYVALLEVERRGKAIEKYLLYGEVDLSESWVINENTIKSVIAKIDEKLMEKYFEDGKYLYNELEEDIFNNFKKQKELKNEMKQAASAYRKISADQVEKLMTDQGVHTLTIQENEYYKCYIFVNAEEFGRILLDNPEEYVFWHATKPSRLEDGQIKDSEDENLKQVVFSNYYYIPEANAVEPSTNRIIYSYENAEEDVWYAFCVTGEYNSKYDGLTEEMRRKAQYRAIWEKAQYFGFRIIEEYPCEEFGCLCVIVGTMEQFERIFKDTHTTDGEFWTLYPAPRVDLLDIMAQVGWDGEADISVGSRFFLQNEAEIKALLGEKSQVTLTVKVVDQE